MSKPTLIKTDCAGIPDVIKAVDNWVCYRAKLITKADGTKKYTKIPVNPRTGGNAKSNDPATWGTFAEAEQYCNSHKDIAGLGYVFQHDKNISAIDIDNCFDAQGNLHPDAEQIISDFDSYTERSPSGNGVHIFVLGTLKKVSSTKYRKPFEFEVEIFCDSYFMTMTGDVAAGPSTAVESRTKKLRELYNHCESAKKTEFVDAAHERPSSLADVNAFEAQMLPALAQYKPSKRRTARSPKGTPGWVWDIECPWGHEHRSAGGGAFVFYFQDGMPAFKCFHTACAGRHWGELVEVAPTLPQPSYVDEFNNKHAVVHMKGKTRVLNEFYSSDGREVDLTISSFEDFRNLYSNRVKHMNIAGRETKLFLANMWLESPRRRQFDRIVFEPDQSQAGLNDYNLFRGFNLQPKPGGSFSLFEEHLLENVCAGNAGYRDWVMAWVARILQDPGSDRPGTCIVMRGGQGTGKSLVGTTFGTLVAPHYMHLTITGHLTGNFNSHLEDKILIFSDEAVFAGDRASVGRLKALITEKRMTIERKGLDVIDVRNHANLMMASNENWVIPADADERRFFVLDIAPNRAKDTKFFGAMVRQLESGGYEALAHALHKIDYRKIDLRLAPVTEALIEQKQASMGSVAQFWSECLEDGHLLRADRDLAEFDSGEDWPDEVPKSEIYYGYCLFCRKNNVRYKDYAASFWRVFKRLAGDWPSRQLGSHGDRERMVSVPKLTDALADWSRALGRVEDLVDGYAVKE